MRIPAHARRLLGRFVRWTGVLGLNYHRIGDGRRSVFDRGLWSATADDFDEQVRFAKKNFDVISPHDISEALRDKRGRHVLFTFDDGYVDNYADAFPILTSHGVPASFFVTTGFIDHPKLPWWDEIAWMLRTSKRPCVSLPTYLPSPVSFDEPDREQAVRTVLRRYKKLPSTETAAYIDAVGEATGTGRAPPDAIDVKSLWMTWDMLREMHAAGMTIGGHSVHHPILARMTPEEQALEIAACERRIVEELGAPMRSFAYPVGSRDAFDAHTQRCLRERGVRAAFSYYGGFRRLEDWDDYDIRRIAVEQDTTFDEFRALVSFPWLD